MNTFGQIVESADELTLEEQQSLLEILQRRLRDKRRAELVKAVQEARKEFKARKVWPAKVDEILDQVLR